MNVPSMLPIFSKNELSKRTSLGRDEEAARKIMMEKPGQSSRELNPYWKNGGTGLPPEKPASASQEKKNSSSEQSSSSRNRERSRSRERKRSTSPREKRGKSPQAKPRFRRPSESDETRPSGSQRYSSSRPSWKKENDKTTSVSSSEDSSSSSSESEQEESRRPVPGKFVQEDKIWTEQELNALNAKIIKAEIMGQQVCL